MAAQFVRRNVHRLGGTWADPLLWYARGVRALRQRALDDPTSWRFLAAIHGFDPTLWSGFGALTGTDRLPKQSVQATYWKQCQHGSWYFLPWHRGYLLAFEAMVRAAVVAQQGPADWALPYWNYLNTGEAGLPAEFASPTWPDGGTNPLFVAQRYGPHGTGPVSVITDLLDLNALGDPDFTGVASGGSPGFGGVDTGFAHGGQVHGRLEKQPHDMVHVLVGGFQGQDLVGGGQVVQRNPGVMTDPDSAGLDPIFWLHHANIDRLWETWRGDPPVHDDPIDAHWLTGPRTRAFAAPNPDGSVWNYTAQKVHVLADLDYTYDDFSPGSALVPPPPPGARVARLRRANVSDFAAREFPTPDFAAPDAGSGGADVGGVGAAGSGAGAGGVGGSGAAGFGAGGSGGADSDVAAGGGGEVELVGANSTELAVVGERVDTTVDIEPEAGDRVTASLDDADRPDRVFLNLENVRGLADGTVLQVYVALPAGADPTAHPERRAGSVGLFGVRKATDPDGEHAGQGLTFVVEITRIVDDLHLDESVAGTLGDRVPVTIVPLRPVAAEEQLTIGRISVFRQPT